MAAEVTNVAPGRIAGVTARSSRRGLLQQKSDGPLVRDPKSGSLPITVPLLSHFQNRDPQFGPILRR